MQNTDVDSQKIDSFFLKTYGIVIAAFQILYKLGYLRFF